MSQFQAFKALHHDPSRVLLLPNVWDAGGARLVESLGAKAVATTSAGVAWSKGYPDGNFMPPALQLRLVEEIVRVVSIPVSIDFEAGYSDDAAQVAENLRPLVAMGIAGINLEDGTGQPEVLARKIEAIKKMVACEGTDVFVNARTDVYFQNLVAGDVRVQETLDRSALYHRAGADGLFVPGMTNLADIEKVAAETALPLNLMADVSLPDAAALAKLNVRRLSAGAAMMKIIYKNMARIAGAFLNDGSCEIFHQETMLFSEMQSLFKGAK